MTQLKRRAVWFFFFGAIAAWTPYATVCHLLAGGMPERFTLGWAAVQTKRFMELPGRALLQKIHPERDPFDQPELQTILCVLLTLALFGALAGLCAAWLSRAQKLPARVSPPSAWVALVFSLAGIFMGGYALGLAGALLGREARLVGDGRKALFAEILGFIVAVVWVLLLTLPRPQGEFMDHIG